MSHQGCRIGYGNRSGSPGKIAARAMAYASIARRDFYNKVHIVILSEECGDVHYLLQRGVSPENILGCDIDPKARRAGRKFGIQISLHDIQTTVAMQMAINRGKHIASINVDLCSSLVKGLPTLLLVCEEIPYEWKGKLFYTFERAFDQRYKLYSTKERIEFLSRELKNKVDWNKSPEDILRDSYEYKSFTKISKGSPMMTTNLSL
jgi:hypothetical protein